MHGNPAVLRQRVRKFESIELDIGIPVGQSLDHSSHDVLRSTVARRYFIADIEDEFPVLGS